MSGPDTFAVPEQLPVMPASWQAHAAELAADGGAEVISSVGVDAQPSAVAMSAVLASVAAASEKLAARTTSSAGKVTLADAVYRENEAASAAASTLDGLLT